MPARREGASDTLQSRKGITVAQMMAEFGILPHTARAMISIGKRRAGLTVELDRETKVYRARTA